MDPQLVLYKNRLLIMLDKCTLLQRLECYSKLNPNMQQNINDFIADMTLEETCKAISFVYDNYLITEKDKALKTIVREIGL
jgi:hypothetical protein